MTLALTLAMTPAMTPAETVIPGTCRSARSMCRAGLHLLALGLCLGALDGVGSGARAEVTAPAMAASTPLPVAVAPMTEAVEGAQDEGPAEDFRFENIDGGDIRMSDFAGQVVLVVNTASRCGFAPQFEGLQTLLDTYGPQGFTVLAVPSNDFRQELGSEAEVKSYCAMTFGIEEMPMTAITQVTGPGAHPFYAWLRDSEGFTPGWNFNKVLMGRDGAVIGTYPANAEPLSQGLRGAVETALAARS